MKGCDYVDELMSLAIDGELDAEGEARLKAHIAVCDRCRTLWEAMNDVSAMLAQAPVLAPSPGFTERVMTQVRREASFRVKLRMGSVLLFSAAYVEALALLLSLAGFVWLLWAFPAKGLFSALILRWTWRLGGVLGTLADVAISFLKQALPPALLFTATSCGMWLLALTLFWMILRRRGFAWVR